jgi:hypothetical protein
MDKHMQQTMPANLKYYQQSGAYVPPHVQQAMAKHMQASMPEHLKQYIDPYVQQRVAPQHLGSAPGAQSPSFIPQSSPSNIQSHQLSQSFEVQPSNQFQPPAQTQNLQQTAEPQVVSTPKEPYAFITNPDNPSAKLPSFLSGKSLPLRIAIIGGAAIALLIILVILKSLFGGSSNLTQFKAVLQDQQELIHLTTNALQPQTGQSLLSDNYQNFGANTQLTATSDKQQLLKYLAKNKELVPPQQLNLKVSKTIDNQLIAAAASGNYSSVFSQIMSDQLNTYKADSRQAYLSSSGINGRTLMNGDYKQALVLISQLKQANTAISN